LNDSVDETRAPAGAVLSSAAARLALSRERLRREMLARSTPRSRAGSRAASQGADAAGSSWPSWQERLKTIPGAAVVIDAIAGWWANHPLNPIASVAVEAARAAVQPMAQRNPLGMVLLALVLGGALAWSRPWRWLLKPALFAGLVPQLVSKLVAHVPLESWMGFASTLGKPKPAGPRQE
jgi:hypothetical protein